MRSFLQLLMRALFFVLIAYLIIAGATLTGTLDPAYKTVTAVLVLPALIIWAAARLRLRWRWHVTPLAGIVLLWVVAMALAFAANTESWRRMLIGFWYAGAYLATWYVFNDLYANKALRRTDFVDALLIGGLFVLLDGYLEFFARVQQWSATPPELREAFYDAWRVWGRLGNPNWLVTFTILAVPLAACRAAVSKSRLMRRILWSYTALLALLGVLTFSRAGWVGLGVMAASLGALSLLTWNRPLLTRLQQTWQAFSPARRRLAAVAAGGAALGLVAAGVLLIVILSSSGGRALDFRTYLYNTAIQMFQEQPVTGHGLFTFGKGLLRLNSVPYRFAHSSAHNMTLNIAAELGLIGLLALGATIGAIAWAARRTWISQPAPETRIWLAGGLAALAGFGAQSFFDWTAVTPVLAFVLLMVVLVVTVPERPTRVLPLRQALQSAAIFALCAALVLTAIWSNNAYLRYLDALAYGLRDKQYAEAARRMQAAVDGDPGMPIYTYYQGMFYASAALDGDSESAARAIEDFERFAAVEPDFSPVWANLAVLYEQGGESDKALAAAERAARAAPEAAPMQANLGRLYEAQGDLERARAAYREALRYAPESALSPFWGETALRREMAAALELSEMPPASRVLSHLMQGEVEAARTTLASAGPRDIEPVVRSLYDLALAADSTAIQQVRARLKLYETNDFDPDTESTTRIALGEAYSACQLGEREAMQKALDRIAAMRSSNPFVYADSTIGLFVQMQYLRIGVPPFFLLGEAWPVLDSHTEALITYFETRMKDCQLQAASQEAGRTNP